MHFRFCFCHVSFRFAGCRISDRLTSCCASCVRFFATTSVRVLRRILRWPCAAFCAASSRAFKVGVGHRPVMLLRDERAMPQPRRGNVRRILGGQFRRATGAQVVRDARPRRQASPLNDSLELRAQVGVVPVARDNRFGSRLGCIEHGFQKRPQLGKERDDARFMPSVPSRLGRMGGRPVALPIHVRPGQRQVFRWAAQSAESAQRDN